MHEAGSTTDHEIGRTGIDARRSSVLPPLQGGVGFVIQTQGCRPGLAFRLSLRDKGTYPPSHAVLFTSLITPTSRASL